jgi:hypothetical protein
MAKVKYYNRFAIMILVNVEKRKRKSEKIHEKWKTHRS